MSEIETLLDNASTTLNKLNGAPAILLVMLASIVVGYALKFWKSFPNNAIPLAVILTGGVGFPVIADANNDLTLRVWLVRNCMIGLVVGLAAWGVHNKVIKPLLDKISGGTDGTPPTGG